MQHVNAPLERPLPYPPDPRLRWCWYALLASTLALLGAYFARGGWIELGEALGFAAASQPLGKFVVFAGLRDEVPFGPWELAALSLLWDLHVAFALAWLLGKAAHGGRVGRWFESRHEKARAKLEAYPGLGRLAFAGLVVFVLLPVGTGPVMGTCVARLLGFSRLRAVLAIGTGCAIATAAFAGLASALGAHGEVLLRNPWISTGVGVALLAILCALGRIALRRLHATA